MMINLNSDTGGASPEVMNTLFQGPVLLTAVVTVLFCVFAFSTRKILYKLHEKQRTVFSGLARRLTALFLALLMLSGGVAFGIKSFLFKSSMRLMLMIRRT